MTRSSVFRDLSIRASRSRRDPVDISRPGPGNLDFGIDPHFPAIFTGPAWPGPPFSLARPGRARHFHWPGQNVLRGIGVAPWTPQNITYARIGHCTGSVSYCPLSDALLRFSRSFHPCNQIEAGLRRHITSWSWNSRFRPRPPLSRHFHWPGLAGPAISTGPAWPGPPWGG